MKRKILSLVIATGLVMSISMSTLAVSLTEKLNSQNKQLLEQRTSYSNQQIEFEKLERAIEILDADIEGIYTAINNAKYEIKDTEIKITQTTKEIVIAEKNIKDEEALFHARMRVMFMNGADSYLEILLNSKGIEDLISRVENVKKIIEYDNKIINELGVKKKNIEKRKNTLKDNKTRVLALKSDNENKLDKLNVKQSEQSELIVQARKQQEINKNGITATQALLDNTINEIKEESDQKAKDLAIANAKKDKVVTPSRGGSSNTSNEPKVEPKVEPKKDEVEPEKPTDISSNAVVSYAKNFIGLPYKWGGNGPTSFDCSGFVKYVYAHFGVRLNRTTYDQIKQGTYVSRANLQPGDLVFFGSGTPHHVGIYVGNNTYIHAPRTGDVIKISAMTRRDYLSARRVR